MSRFPKGSRPGQWGHYVNVDGQVRWVRLADEGSGKIRMMS